MASSSRVSSNYQWKYDVFLSFRGDTRQNFTDHLYAALIDKGIETFRDKEGLERGKEISTELLRAIEESQFSIIILSKNYASSKWCLEEVAKIVDCIKDEEKQHTTFPVFYDVEPRDVRKQTGDFKEAFDNHEKENKAKVERWRLALKHVGSLSGWHLQDRYEAELVQEIIEEISMKLDIPFSSPSKELVGIESRVEKMKEYIDQGPNEVSFIGMWGMGGIGKSTLARVVFERFSKEYDGRSFLANVREVSEKGNITQLQERLIYDVLKERNLNILDAYEGTSLIRRRLFRKRVFLVLDDVNQLDQLEKLAGRHDWFRPGSRIIITTRDEQILISHGVKCVYKVQELNDHEALKLFNLKAFKHNKPISDAHFHLSQIIINHTNRLPLALEVLGSFLCNRSVEEWESTLERLQKHPGEIIDSILKELRISYDGLSSTDKKIFLDIACFFKGKDKDRVKHILDGCDFSAIIGIRVLIQKSLITVSNDKIWMHDMIQQMGWKIVSEEFPKEPGKWSRLWLSDNIYHVLEENKGTHEVEAIILDKPKKQITKLKGNSFSNMNYLRLLKISNFHISEDIEYLSNELRFMKWHFYPLKSLPSSFHPEKIVELNMCHSHIEYLWESTKTLYRFQKLKTIKLSHSLKLIRTPDFTEVSNLVKLDLEGCISLIEVHQSVGLLKKLVELNLKNCKKLVLFPSSIRGLTSLKILNLFGCSNLDKLPQDLGEAELLEELDASGTAITEVPRSIVRLTKLKALSFHGCRGQQRQTWSSYLQSLLMPTRNRALVSLCLPSFTGLSSLVKLDLGDCNLLEGALPSDFGSLSSLEQLDLRENNFLTLPKSIKKLLKLKILSLEKCKMLMELPQLPPQLAFAGAEDCSSLQTVPCSLLEQCTSSNFALHLFNCPKLAENHRGLAEMFIKLWFQKFSHEHSHFHILLPGSEIPKWYTHQRNQRSIEIPLPHNWLNDEFIGFAICAAFAFPTSYSSEGPLEVHCKVQILKYWFTITFAIPSFTKVESDHLCLVFLSYKMIEERLQSSLCPFDGMMSIDDEIPSHLLPLDKMNLRELLSSATHVYTKFSIQVLPENWSNLYDYFVLGEHHWNIFVKRCGIRLVYTQDVENFETYHNFEELPVAKVSIVEQSNDALEPHQQCTAVDDDTLATHCKSIRPLFYTSHLLVDPSRKEVAKVEEQKLRQEAKKPLFPGSTSTPIDEDETREGDEDETWEGDEDYNSS